MQDSVTVFLSCSSQRPSNLKARDASRLRKCLTFVCTASETVSAGRAEAFSVRNCKVMSACPERHLVATVRHMLQNRPEAALTQR